MSDIPKDIMATVDDGELEDLVSSYVFSVNFDGAAGEEMRAVKEWAARAILAERERAATIAQKWASDDSQHGEARLIAAYIAKDIKTGR